MRSRRVRTIVALAPILIAVLVGASVAASGGPRAPAPAPNHSPGGRIRWFPRPSGGDRDAQPDQARADHHHSPPGHDDNDRPARGH